MGGEVYGHDFVLKVSVGVEYLIRFLLGGVAVSLFAVIGDVLQPKRFAGIFGAAPSVALATLALTVHSRGETYAAIEARSMIAGAVALLIYAAVCRAWFRRGRSAVTAVTLASLAIWFALALAGGLLLSKLPS